VCSRSLADLEAIEQVKDLESSSLPNDGAILVEVEISRSSRGFMAAP
jgi:hypothetical protein